MLKAMISIVSILEQTYMKSESLKPNHLWYGETSDDEKIYLIFKEDNFLINSLVKKDDGFYALNSKEVANFLQQNNILLKKELFVQNAYNRIVLNDINKQTFIYNPVNEEEQKEIMRKYNNIVEIHVNQQ